MNKRSKKNKNKKRTDDNEFGTNESGASKTEENQENLDSQTGEITEQTQEENTNAIVEQENQQITNSVEVDPSKENSNHHHSNEEKSHKFSKEINDLFDTEKAEEKKTAPIEEKINNEVSEKVLEDVPVHAELEQENLEKSEKNVAVNPEFEHEKVEKLEEEVPVNTEVEQEKLEDDVPVKAEVEQILPEKEQENVSVNVELAKDNVAVVEEVEQTLTEKEQENVSVNVELAKDNVAVVDEVEHTAFYSEPNEVQNINKIEEHLEKVILEDHNNNEEAVKINSDIHNNVYDSEDLVESNKMVHKHVSISAYASLEDAKDSSVEVTDHEALNAILNAKLNEVHTLETEENVVDVIEKLPIESKHISQDEVHVNLEDSNRKIEEHDEAISKQKDRIIGKVSVDKKETTASQKMEKFSEVTNNYSDASSLGNVRKSKADNIRLIDEINIDKEKDHNLDEMRRNNNICTSDAEVQKARSGVCSKCIIY